MSLPYIRASMKHSELSKMDLKQQINRSPNGQVRLDCQMDQFYYDLFAPPQLTYSEYMNMADGDNEFDWSAGFGKLFEESYGQVGRNLQMDHFQFTRNLFAFESPQATAENDNDFDWADDFANLFEESYGPEDYHQNGAKNRQKGEWTTEQIQDSTVRSTTTPNSNASTEDHLLSFGNKFDQEMFYQMNRGYPMESWQTFNTPPFKEHYGQRQYNLYDKVGQMESYNSEATSTPSFTEHYGQCNSYNIFDLMERGEIGVPKTPPFMEHYGHRNSYNELDRMERGESQAFNTPPFIKYYDQCNSYDEVGRMGTYQREATNTRSTIKHYNHVQCNSSESMAMEQMECDTTDSTDGKEAKANQFTVGPIVRNVRKRNPPSQCHYCNKSFLKKAYLISHLRVHTGDRPYQCDLCRRRFAHKGNLRTHARRHANLKPFSCKFCDWSFSARNTLKRHVESNHLNIKPYRCTKCRLYFSTSSNTICHVRAAHFGLPRTLKEQRERNIIDHRDASQFVEKSVLVALLYPAFMPKRRK